MEEDEQQVDHPETVEEHNEELADQSDEDSSSNDDDDDDDEDEDDRPFRDRVNGEALFRYIMQTLVTPGHQSRNNNMLIASLQESEALKTEKIIQAFKDAPRADFLLPDMRNEAYIDNPLRFSTMGFNISAPHMYAMCLENLQLEEGNTFLDIGSGCGLFTLMGGLLVGPTGVSHGLDIRKDIVTFGEQNVQKWKDAHPDREVNVTFEERNCFLVDCESRVWDRIHVGACCPEFQLENLYQLLKPNGRLVTPYGDKLILAVKDETGNVTIKKLSSVRYGDLIIPSEAERREANLKFQSLQRQTITVPDVQMDENFSNLLNDEKTSDFRLIVEGKVIYTHKDVLRTRCTHFERMFESGMRESCSEELVILDFTYDQMMAVLQVLYTSECDVTSENVVDLLQVSDFFKVEWLKCKCEQVLHDNIEVESAAQLLYIADRYDAKQLRSACFEYVLKNYQAILLTEGFQQLQRELIIEVMKEACSRASI